MTSTHRNAHALSRRSFIALGTAALAVGSPLCTASLPRIAEATEPGIELVDIPAGTFSMGSPDSERQRQADETQHDVTLSAFRLAPYEVMQAEYARVMGTNPSANVGDNLPVEQVSWYDAIEFCNRISDEQGLTRCYEVGEDGSVSWDRSADGYRLPTEAEWEYAARAGSTGIFPAGEQITSDVANFEGSYPYLIEENYVMRRDPAVVTSANRGQTIGVAELPPNAWGLYNMCGNVSEWCFDLYAPYGPEAASDPAGPTQGSLRTNRGGGYDDFAKQLRSAYRSACNPSWVDRNMGFRVARNANASDAPSDVVATEGPLSIAVPAEPRILIAYFSHSGNTARAAQMIADKTGAPLFEIAMAQPYQGNIYEDSQADMNNNVHPPLAAHVDDIASYDVVLLGYPTWWSTIPMPVATFLDEHDLTGKLIATFSSNGGTRFGDSLSDVAKAAQGSVVTHGFEFTYSGGGSLSGDIDAWLARIGLGTAAQ
ncbi:MAG: SUMF1/EgtB/PvdO family nonheme iron enzyme [Coriobacteriia bacterium]|nr:SUMF1/EgtB/PvdO family nonheme iron enzyme [Coriobacteriia bacterium]MBS5477081.1 SUMF1/EgtB/PvdO family nonheme iron enzyme [Coriobacteriia bacterium]